LEDPQIAFEALPTLKRKLADFQAQKMEEMESQVDMTFFTAFSYKFLLQIQTIHEEKQIERAIPHHYLISGAGKNIHYMFIYLIHILIL
jgi:hypothetical protein